MALQSCTLTIGALIDENNSGKNYVSDQPVYIKTKAGVLAPIFRDINGTSEIFQDGLSNKTDSRGQFVFFVEQGDYIAEYQSQQTPISVFGADYFNSRIDESVAKITADTALSRGYNRKGTFASGFTYELANDVGIDGDGNAWVYTNIDALPVTVTASTVPSEPEYTPVTFNELQNLSGLDKASELDLVYDRSSTVAEVAIGLFSVGSRLKLTDRGGAMFNVVAGGVPDGLRTIDAGNGNTAILEVIGNSLRAEQAGILGDWDGNNGTDETAKLQALVDSFNNETGKIDMSALNIRADSARIDFKRVSLKGGKAPSAGYKSGASIYVGSLGGLYTSIEANTSPELAYLKIFSADERTKNGQTVVDLTGLNYPRMNNVLIYGGENGLKLQDGASVESHYGNFYSVDISRSYNGVMVLGGNRTQTHSFYGGRIWDCVESYVNAEGTSDINFYGTAFEGDRSAQHLNAGSNPDAAETNFFGGRDECDSDPDIQVGSIKQIGTYWSGNKKPATQTISTSELTEIQNQVMIQGVRDDLVPIGYNVLKNPNFEPDLADSSIIAGWEVISANLHAIEKGSFGNVAHIRGIDATQRTAIFRQSGIKVKKGWYTWGVAYERLGVTGVLTTRLDDNGTLLIEGVDFEGVAVNTTATGDRIHRIKFLRDIDSLRYEVRVATVGDEDDLYMSYPFLVQGRNSDKHQSYNKAPIQEGYASSVPTSGFHTAGDKVYNLDPAEIGAELSKYVVTGWMRLTTGTGNVLNTDWVEMRCFTGN